MKKVFLLRSGLWCMVLAVILAGFCAAQDPVTGELAGTVRDPTGALVPAAKVQVTNLSTGATYLAQTTLSGEFKFASLLPGAYDAVVEAAGFSHLFVHGSTVLVGKTTSLDLALRVATVVTQLEITGAPPTVQTARSDIGEVIERQRLASLPLKNRDFADLAATVPQVVRTPPVDPSKERVGNISVAGTSGRQSNVFVDGFENYDIVTGGLAYDISTDGIQEFNVVTTRFTAEQGRSAGAVVNIVQRSGANNFHGDTFYFFRNENLGARDYFETAKTDFRRQQYGATEGGALRKDKLFQFVAFEDHRELGSGVVNTNGTFPQFDRTVPVPFRREFLTGKIDYVRNPQQRMFVRYNLDTFNGTEAIGGSHDQSNGRTDRSNTHAAAFSHTYVISPHTLNSAGVQYSHYDNHLNPLSHDHSETRPDLVIGQLVGTPQSTRENHFIVKDDVGLSRGSHSIWLGGEYHYAAASANFTISTVGNFVFFSDAALGSQFADLLVMSRCAHPDCSLGDIASNVVGLYVHDDWKATRRLRACNKTLPKDS